MQIGIPTCFQAASATDLEKIRADAGNPQLTGDDVVVFGKSMIARTDIPANRVKFTRESLIQAAPTFLGKAVNFDHQSREATKQVARVFDAFTEDVDGVTFLYVRSYAIKTASDADLHTKMLNRQFREQSMGIDIIDAKCSECNMSIVKGFAGCPGHPGADVVVKNFTGNHVSYVGQPAVENAGVIAEQARKAEVFLTTFGYSSLAAAEKSIKELQPLAEDGREFRQFARNEFTKWYRLANRDVAPEEVESLAEKLSAKEMVRFARINKEQFNSVIPDGRQLTQFAENEDKEEQTEPIDLASIQAAMKGKQ